MARHWALIIEVYFFIETPANCIDLQFQLLFSCLPALNSHLSITIMQKRTCIKWCKMPRNSTSSCCKLLDHISYYYWRLLRTNGLKLNPREALSIFEQVVVQTQGSLEVAAAQNLHHLGIDQLHLLLQLPTQAHLLHRVHQHVAVEWLELLVLHIAQSVGEQLFVGLLDHAAVGSAVINQFGLITLRCLFLLLLHVVTVPGSERIGVGKSIERLLTFLSHFITIFVDLLSLLYVDRGELFLHVLNSFLLLADAGLEVSINAVDEAPLGFDIASFCLPVVDVGIVAVLDHMFRPDQLKLPRDECPFAALLLNELKELEVLLEAPLLLVEVGVEIVAPFLSAVLERLEVGSFGLAKEGEGDLLPVIFLLASAGFGICLLYDFGKEAGFRFSPALSMLDFAGVDGCDFIPEELKGSLRENGLYLSQVGVILYNIQLTNYYKSNWCICVQKTRAQQNTFLSPKAQAGVLLFLDLQEGFFLSLQLICCTSLEIVVAVYWLSLV